LVFSDVELVIREAPENLEFIRRFLPKLDWAALVDTARSVSIFLDTEVWRLSSMA
jgi:multifunctional methyltransferase subunit TRM112